MIDPHLRQRGGRIKARARIETGLSNIELVERFERAVLDAEGMTPEGLGHYVAICLDAVRFFIDADGKEQSVDSWTKPDLWRYLDHVQANYCGSFLYLAFRKEKDAACKKYVWRGPRPIDEALATCRECRLFKAPDVRYRVNALVKWFKWLSRVGAISQNPMLEVISEYYEEHKRDAPDGEKRRHPSIVEVRKLVNKTAHPQRRAFYASSAKWGFRPNEMLMLDRYASFGLPMPQGHPLPKGFKSGFPTYPQTPSFADGGDMVYVPRNKGKRDKRKGNRWSVIDAELRPLLEQHFAWWERTVKRDEKGRPLTTKLWLNGNGTPLRQAELYPGFFYNDCERLGLMVPPSDDSPGDRGDPLRRWTGHCQRHLFEQICENAQLHPDWTKHLRGDGMPDSRGDYYQPPPEHVRKHYLNGIPFLGFKPLADAPRVAWATEAETHSAILAEALDRARPLAKRRGAARGAILVCVQIVSSSGELWIVPRRIAPSFLFALKCSRPEQVFQVQKDPGSKHPGRWRSAADLIATYEAGLGMLAASTTPSRQAYAPGDEIAGREPVSARDPRDRP